jgi:hypothetical protein
MAEERDGVYYDGFRVLHPGDAGYDEALALAARIAAAGGPPIPYTDDAPSQSADT